MKFMRKNTRDLAVGDRYTLSPENPPWVVILEQRGDTYVGSNGLFAMESAHKDVLVLDTRVINTIQVDPSDVKRLPLKGTHIIKELCPHCSVGYAYTSAFYSAGAEHGDDVLEYPSNGTHNAIRYCYNCGEEEIVGTFEVEFQATFTFVPITPNGEALEGVTCLE